jgi:hypothetical protein
VSRNYNIHWQYQTSTPEAEFYPKALQAPLTGLGIYPYELTYPFDN